MKKSFLLLCLMVALVFDGYAQFNPQSSAITERYFPDPVIDIPTPAFQKQKGFTTLAEMQAWLSGLKPAAGVLLVPETIGKTQKGKDLITIKISKSGGSNTKLRVWLQGGLHGDEPAGTESLLFVIHSLITNPEWTGLLDRLEILVLPMANVDGYESLKRESANGIDLNRDQTRFSAPETAFIKAAYSAFAPEVALDFHEFRPFRKDFSRIGAGGVTTYHDVMFLYSGNLNVPEAVRQFTRTAFVNPAKQVIAAQGLNSCDYVTTEKVGGQVQFNMGSIHARSSASNYALTNAISTLFEIRGVGIGRTSFKRRVQTGWLVARSYLQSAYQKADSVKLVLAQAALLRGQVVVKSERKKYTDTLRFIDLTTENVVPLKVTINNALQSKPVLTRTRPYAYLLLPTEKRAVRNLILLGIKVDSLSQPKELELEAYNNLEKREQEEQDQDNEESGLATTTASTALIKRQLPAGTYLVWLDQQRANLACEVLEPENPNGFVAMKVIRPEKGDLPIYRYLKPERP